ncbi:hypothetical protein G0Q06_10530 [Puniceicoccales bacterium CK1056]|uniref:alpha-L-fucosidase n=1 Tax=Oceanipulchritudo coccoides TaxID=2706888 RepID=A0A6B2M474_9BACT|nr:alpha-L-fucosidase [Oceanipulchritudo coccoides]NDV62887.1 hypothetical protein [Oceanipulchritudo coccoides]
MMKTLLIPLTLCYALSSTAETQPTTKSLIETQGLRYVSQTETGTRYQRFREDILELPRKELGLNPDKARNTTGGIIAFRTDAPEITARFKILSANYMGSGFGVFENGTLVEEFKFSPKETEAVLTVTSQRDGDSLFEIALPSFANVEFQGVDAACSALPPVKKRVYVALGDSISHGNGQDGFGHKTWPFLLSRKLGYELFNLAVGGGKVSVPVAEMLEDWDSIDLITILIGYNDLHYDQKTPEQYRAKVNELLDTIRKNHPDTRIICITPLFTKRPVSDKTGATIEEFRSELVDLVTARMADDKNLSFINGEEVSSEKNLRLEKPDDPVHLGIEGAELLASALAEKILFRANETAEERDARMAWWREAKFGMFVHWGIYAAAEGEWKGATFPDMRPGFEWLMCKGEPGGIDKDEYVEALAPKMTLERFDPEQWAVLAAEAGMKYFVITAKHHDGFGMVDFPFTALDIADRTPYAADPMVPLSKAMRANGLKFGFYFSQSQDWSRPGARPNWYKGLDGDWNEYVDQFAAPQLRHLLGGTYGNIDLLWFDSGRSTKTREGAMRIWQELTAQPDILVNNRLKLDEYGDFDCPEQWIPPSVQDKKTWETCMTMNGGWGYNPTDTNWKSTDELIRNLCLVVSRGGNYLLNIGPRADGTWEPQVVERLKGIGAWMRTNSEAIYGTRPNPIGPIREGSITWKPTGESSRLYVHIMDWPADGKIYLPLKSPIRAARFLGDSDTRPTWETGQDSTIIHLNRDKPIHPAATVLVLDLNTPSPEAMPLVVRQDQNGGLLMLAVEAQGEGGLHVHNREPCLDGWSGRNQERRLASWTVRVDKGGTFVVNLKYGFNTDQDIGEMAFVVETQGKDIRMPIQITGVEPDSHNKERNQLVSEKFQSGEVIDLPPGLHTIKLLAEGAPEAFKRPPGRENQILCYTGFPMLKELRLELIP